MTYEYLKMLKASNPALKLLCSDNFAMSVSFFYKVFIEDRQKVLAQHKIVSLLDDYLYALAQIYPKEFPKEAQAYLDDFARAGFLRKYYADAQEPLYELTPHSQRVLEWIESLRKREFVASRSRLDIIFDLLEELEFETALDDEARIERLEAKKRRIDEEIAAIRSKRALRFDSSRIKEHYMQIEEIARRLLYDFGEIEYNFRELNRAAMEKIATSEDAKGEVLGSIFALEDSIRQSDQGKSFFAFWRLLTDTQRSEKLSAMLKNLYTIDTIESFDPDRRLRRLKYDLLDSGEKIAQLTSRLAQQLRRFIDDRVWIENRRILELCGSIEKEALKIRENAPKSRTFALLRGERVAISSIASKKLYQPRQKREFEVVIQHKEDSIDVESFFWRYDVDEGVLRRRIEALLRERPLCTLGDIAQRYGIKKGVSELIAYIGLAKGDENAEILESEIESLEISDFEGRKKIVKLPKIIFTKG